MRRYYSETLLEPISIEPDKPCEIMGFSVKRARISADGNVFGCIYYYDAIAEIYDDSTESVHTESIPAGAGAILVDTTASWLYGMVRSTILLSILNYNQVS